MDWHEFWELWVWIVLQGKADVHWQGIHWVSGGGYWQWAILGFGQWHLDPNIWGLC